MSIVVIVIAAILLLASFVYPVMSLMLFLNTALFKGWMMLRFSFFRAVDFTVLCAILVLVAMAYHFLRNGLRMRDIVSVPLLMYLALAGVLLLGVTYTSAPNYGLQKSTRFATLTLIAFFAPIAFAHRFREFKLMVWILIIAGIVCAIGTVVDPHGAVIKALPESRAGFLEADPLGTATRVAMAAAILFVFLIMSGTPFLLRVASFALIGLMMVSIIITGSRGPFLGLAFTWLATIFICHRAISKAWVPVVVAATLVVMVVAFAQLPRMATERIGAVWTSGYEAKQAAFTRTEMFVWAARQSVDRPLLGHGTGAFAVDRGGPDERYYPHNIILEMLYEQGLLGAVVVSLFLWLIFRRWRQAAQFVRYYDLGKETFLAVHIAGLVFLFAFTQALKSGDVNDNRIMFFCAGLVMAAYGLARRAVEEGVLETELAVEAQEDLAELELQNSGVLY